MKINFNKSIIVFLSASSLLFFAANNVFGAENKSENVRNSVSATANTGGNKIEGNGTITTGDAKATVKSTNIVNGGTNVQNKTEAKAEVQGDGATASVEVNGEKKACTAENGEGCEVEITNADNSASATVETEETAEEENNSLTVLEKIESIAKNIISEIGRWFS